MSKHIVKKIWIWIIGLSILISLGFSSISYYRNIVNGCKKGTARYTLQSLSFKKVNAADYKEINIAPEVYYADPCYGYKTSSWLSISTQVLYPLYIGLVVASVLNVILEFVYYIYSKTKYGSGHINLNNFIFSFSIVMIAVVLFIMSTAMKS